MTHQHSRVLFTLEDGRPLQFQIPPCEDKKKLKDLVEHGGGILSSKYEKNSIRLAVQGKKVHEDGALDIKYITDCVEQNKLLSVSNYKLYSGDVLKVNDDDLEPAANVIHLEAKDRQGRKKYLLSEDLRIIKWLIDEGHYSNTGGNTVWKELERLEVVPGHSWQSMRAHYRKHVLPNIGSYNLDDHYKAKLTNTIAGVSSSFQSPASKKKKSISIHQFLYGDDSNSTKSVKNNGQSTSSNINQSKLSRFCSKNIKNSVHKDTLSITNSRQSLDKSNVSKKSQEMDKEEIVIDSISPIATVCKVQNSKTNMDNHIRDCGVSPSSFYSPGNSAKCSDISETLDDFDKELLNYATPSKDRHLSQQQEKSAIYNDHGAAKSTRSHSRLASNNEQFSKISISGDTPPETDKRNQRSQVNTESNALSNGKPIDFGEVTSTSDVAHKSHIISPQKTKGSTASDEPSSSQPLEHCIKTSKNKQGIECNHSESPTVKSKYFTRAQCANNENVQSNNSKQAKTSLKSKANKNFDQKKIRTDSSDGNSDSSLSDSLLNKQQKKHPHKRYLRSNSQDSGTSSSLNQVVLKKKKLHVIETSSDQETEKSDVPKVVSKCLDKSQKTCRNIRRDLSEDSEEIECVQTRSKQHTGNIPHRDSKCKPTNAKKKKRHTSPKGLRSFLMKETQSAQSQSSQDSSNCDSEGSDIETEEFRRAVQTFKKVSKCLNLTPPDLLQVCHWVGGDLDEAVYYAIHGETKSGYPAWKLADDIMLQECNEKQYQLLEVKFGEQGVLQRQQYLNENDG